jgi:hypothetical protein
VAIIQLVQDTKLFKFNKSVIFLVKTGYLSSLNAVTINTSGVSTVNNPQRMGQLSQDLKIEPSIFSTQPHILLISLIKSVMKVYIATYGIWISRKNKKVY